MGDSNLAIVLVSCIRKGVKADFVKLIRKEGKNILKLTEPNCGQTALHVAAEEGFEDIVKVILEDKYKVDVNAVDENGWTPLHSASKGGNLSVLEMLLKKGAFARALTNEGSSAMHYLVRNDYSSQLSKFNNVLTLLLKKGCVVDTQNTHGHTPLHQAAMRGKLESITLLLKHQAKPNLVTRHGETALYFAIRGGHVECVEHLLQNGADPTIGDSPDIVFSTAKKVDNQQIIEMITNWYSHNSVDLPSPSPSIELKPYLLISHKNLKPLLNTNAAPPVVSPHHISPNSSSEKLLTPDHKKRIEEEVYGLLDDFNTPITPTSQNPTPTSPSVSGGGSSGGSGSGGGGSGNNSNNTLNNQPNNNNNNSGSGTEGEGGYESTDSSSGRAHSNSFDYVFNRIKGRDPWVCRSCMDTFSHLPLTFFCQNPNEYELIPIDQRSKRVRMSTDLCIIDDNYYIRGVLDIPLNMPTSDSDKGCALVITWGVWVKVEYSDFDLIIKEWSTDQIMSVKGALSNNIPLYLSYNLSVSVSTRAGGARPVVTIENSDHPLCVDQINGITFDRFELLLDQIYLENSRLS